MGIDVSKIQNAALRKLADKANVNDNDKTTLNRTEFIDFTVEAMESKKTKKAWTELFGHTTEPNSREEVKQEKTRLAQDNLSKTEKRELKNNLQKLTTLSEVEAYFNNPELHSSYNDIKEASLMMLNEIKSMNINSKDDVEAIKDKIKDKFKNTNGLNGDILNILVDIAEKEQIQKETQRLIDIYHSTSESQDVLNRFDSRVEAVRAKMDEMSLTGTSYYKKAFENMMAEVMKDADYEVDNLRKGVKGTTSKEIRKELEEKAMGDKTLEKAIKKDKVDNELQARYTNYNIITRMLKDNMDKDSMDAILQEKLDKDTYIKIRNAYQKEDGKYMGLVGLQAGLKDKIGSDLKLNASQNTEIAELTFVKRYLKDATGSDFSDSQVKDLVKFLGFEYETKDRSLETVMEDTLPGAIIGAGSAAAFATRLKVEQYVNMKITADLSESLKSQLGDKIVASSTDSDGLINLKVAQKVVKDDTIIAALSGAGIGTIVTALFNLIEGKDIPFEKACFSKSELSAIVRGSESLEDAKNKICQQYQGLKGSILSALLQKAHDAKPDDWKNNYINVIDKIAGKYSNMNCEELQGVKFDEIEELLAEELHTYNTKDTEGTPDKLVAVQVDTIDARKSSWSKLVEQYDCLKDIEIDPNKYPLSAKKDKETLAIRMLKVAQAINDNDYSKERLLDLAEKTFAADRNYTQLKDYEGIDYNVLVGTMKAELMGTKVKMPAVLAYEKVQKEDGTYEIVGGCNRTNKDIKATVEDNTGTKAAVDSAQDYVTKKGEDGKLYVKFDGGDWIECQDELDRNAKIEEFKAKYKNVKKEEE
ncbi:hypothetical protein IJ384_02175 [bacterium]|nr:hypothetical protein [bacterium]